MSEGGKTKHMSLSLGRDVKQNVQQIAQFSNKDAVVMLCFQTMQSTLCVFVYP